MFGYNFDSSNLAMRVDEVSSALTYVGYTPQNGNNVNDPIWYIKRIQTIGTQQIIMRSKGVLAFECAWSDRATLSYS